MQVTGNLRQTQDGDGHKVNHRHGFQRDQHSFLFCLKEQFLQNSLGGRAYKKINDPVVGMTEIFQFLLFGWFLDFICC